MTRPGAVLPGPARGPGGGPARALEPGPVGRKSNNSLSGRRGHGPHHQNHQNGASGRPRNDPQVVQADRRSIGLAQCPVGSPLTDGPVRGSPAPMLGLEAEDLEIGQPHP